MESEQRSPVDTEDEAYASDAPAPGRSGDSMGDDTRKTGHILIVDDDPTMRQMVTGYFEEHNVPAGAVSSRSELSRHFAGAHLSLIIWLCTKLHLHLSRSLQCGHGRRSSNLARFCPAIAAGLSAIVVSPAGSSCRGEGRQTSRDYRRAAVGSV